MNGELPLIYIKRIIHEPYGTYGMLYSGKFKCFTIERPWRGNCPWKSCIPTGLYKAHRGTFGRGRPPYNDLEIEDVPGRSAIEIHSANLPSELNGCIAPAEYLGWHKDVIKGSNSKLTLEALLQSFDTDEVYVLIT